MTRAEAEALVDAFDESVCTYLAADACWVGDEAVRLYESARQALVNALTKDTP